MGVSVAMCTFNGAPFLDEQLRSIADQRLRPDELVACDDGSSDRTVDILHDFAKRAPFPVHVHINAENLGYVKNFEKAIGLCQSDFIALCDQDDVWDPRKLALSATLLDDCPEVGLVCTDAEQVGRQLEPTGLRLSSALAFGPAEQAQVASGKALSVLVRINFVTGTTMMFRSSLRSAVLPMPDGWIHDAWIALVASVTSAVAFIAEPLVLYRQHGDNQIGAPRKVRLSTLISPTGSATGALADALRWQIARERIAAIARDQDLQLLLAKERHTAARARLPAGRLSRLPRIGTELLHRNYHKYSAGLGSALKDLLAAGSPE